MTPLGPAPRRHRTCSIAQHRLVLALLVTAAGLLGPTGCSDDDPATSRPTAIAPAQHVAGSYALNGVQRRVRTSLTPVLIATARRNDAAVIPRGDRAVQVDLRIGDTGRDRLDPSVLRFTARDSTGRPLREAFRLPIRTPEPANRAGPRILTVAFLIRRGERLTLLGASSILKALPLRLRWRIDG